MKLTVLAVCLLSFLIAPAIVWADHNSSGPWDPIKSHFIEQNLPGVHPPDNTEVRTTWAAIKLLFAGEDNSNGCGTDAPPIDPPPPPPDAYYFFSWLMCGSQLF